MPGSDGDISGGPGCASCADPPARAAVSREPDGGRPEGRRRPEKTSAQSPFQAGDGRRPEGGSPWSQEAGRQDGAGWRTGLDRIPNFMD